MLTDKVHPEISKILLYHSPWFTCPFCKTGMRRTETENTKHVYYICPLCTYDFGVYNYYTHDELNYIKLPMVCRVKFKINDYLLNIVYDKEPMIGLSIYKDGTYQNTIQINAAPKLNFKDVQSIKDKIKLWMTFS